MAGGLITTEFLYEQDREIGQPFFDDTEPLSRNRRLEGGIEYVALPGSRTWLEETVEQRLYYSANYGYDWLLELPLPGHLVVPRISRFAGGMSPRSELIGRNYRWVHREPLTEWEVHNIKLHRTANAAALQRLNEVWEAGFADDGRIERSEEALAIHSLLDTPADWEVIHCPQPGTGEPAGSWKLLGIDVAQWGYGFYTAPLDVANEAEFEEHIVLLNGTGLFPGA